MINFEACWQKELANSFTDPTKLLTFLQISSEKYTEGTSARQLFPLRVPRPFANKMKKGDNNDPLLLQVITQKEEFLTASGYSTDPLEEHDAVIPGLLHKYKSRTLMIVKGGCAINCRYCFRRHFPYQDNTGGKLTWQAALDYIKTKPEINEVILSGGDPLMAKDKQLIELIEAIANIGHVKRVRIHSRLPVVIPQRITPELVKCLTELPIKVIFVHHINHANEIDADFMAAIKPLQVPNITLLNQAVLLKGVNDTTQAMVDLSERLFAAGILPYYIHLLDKVQGAAHFAVTEETAARVYKGMLAELPGFLMPKWAREIGGEASKTPIFY
ncbi:EF-P beta-lysylation protein EpmB [Algibacillus agarilyticus]|uniref:EF-P beta-lysylation protein EpmB n=1 Tax=Algibacillus agarilyticus TaxID=2234133 RepID=UPI000DD053CC|nr:EF-P beta-lysylation protein EpmB [Algibacillus agarilyticus]